MKAPPEARFTDGACSLPLRPDEVKVGDCCGGQRGAELAVHRRGQEIFGLVSAAGGVGGGCGGPQGTVEFGARLVQPMARMWQCVARTRPGMPAETVGEPSECALTCDGTSERAKGIEPS
jgi:hypothetical protein